jgi:hypothetical protein
MFKRDEPLQVIPLGETVEVEANADGTFSADVPP